MVLVQKSNRSEMPPDAIVLTPNEAIKLQLENYERLDLSTTWPVLYGRKILAIPIGLQIAFMIDKFRRKYRLGNYGLISTMLPFAAVPTITIAYLQDSIVTHKMILQNECSVCIHTNSVLASTFTSNFVGGVGGAMATLYYAHRQGSYVLPPLKWSSLQVFGKHVLNLNKRCSHYHWISLAINIFLSAGVIYLQEKAVNKVNQILEEEDYELAKQSYLRAKQRRYNV